MDENKENKDLVEDIPDIEGERGKVKEEIIEATQGLSKIDSEEGLLASASDTSAFITPEVEGSSNRDTRGARRKSSNGKGQIPDLILGDIYDRALKVSDRLKSHLAGTVRLDITDEKLSYYFNWSTEGFNIKEDLKEKADCTIEMKKKELLSIAFGDLNAQIAMLSEKISVKGKMDLAIYFFNLFVHP